MKQNTSGDMSHCHGPNFFPFHFLFPFSLCHDPNVNCFSWPYNQSYSLCSTLVCTKSATTNMEWREYYHNLDYKQCDLRSVPSAWLSGVFFFNLEPFLYVYKSLHLVSSSRHFFCSFMTFCVASWNCPFMKKCQIWCFFVWKNRVLNSTSES
jgi:hypothetical protein